MTEPIDQIPVDAPSPNGSRALSETVASSGDDLYQVGDDVDDSDEKRRLTHRAERAVAARYWGAAQPRIVLTFLAMLVAWSAVIWLGLVGVIPLWVGLILNSFLASTFYMPMHEAIHGNILGKSPKSRWGEDVIGMVCSIPLGFSYKPHRASHMRHHAYTNQPGRDPDLYTDGPLSELPLKWLSIQFVSEILPLLAFVPSSRRLIPSRIKGGLRADSGSKSAGLQQLRFWIFTHGILLIAFLLGVGWPALLLWYLPAKIQSFWLTFIFAWYPHHPANEVGRYVDTRVAVFRGSRFIIRGHDHHAMHHLFPRVPHYRLRELWADLAEEMVPKGVRSEGRALEATGPVIW